MILIQAWWAASIILFYGNPAAWTLTCEAFFYALRSWISRVLISMAKRGALWVTAGVIVYAFVYRIGAIAATDSWLPAVPVPVQRVPEFILGMALAWAVRSGWRPRVHPLAGVAAMALAIVAIGVSSRWRGACRFWGQSLPSATSFAVGCAIAIVALAAASLERKRVYFDTKAQVKLGEWSFAFYLVHATVIHMALRVLGLQDPSWRNLLWYAAMFVVCLMAS